MTDSKPDAQISLATLIAHRERFGAYARLVQIIAEISDRIYPALVRLRDAIERDVRPAIPAPDAEFTALAAAAFALADSPAKLIEAISATIADKRELLPDLFPAGGANSKAAAQAACEAVSSADVKTAAIAESIAESTPEKIAEPEAVPAKILPGPGFVKSVTAPEAR